MSDGFPDLADGIDPEAATALVLDLTASWAAGSLPLSELVRLSTPHERYACRRSVKPVRGGVDHELLTRLFEPLALRSVHPETGAVRRTPHGLFTDAEYLRDSAFERYERSLSGKYKYQSGRNAA